MFKQTHSARIGRLSLALAALLLPASLASATVNLRFTNTPVLPIVPDVDPQVSNFTVRLVLDSTGELTTGLDYRLESANATGTSTVSNFFRILDRDVSVSPYSEATRPDSEIETTPSATLAPRNGNTLGASLPGSEIFNPKGAGTWIVADYTIAIAANTPGGVYTLRTVVTDPALGYIDQEGADHPFNQHASMTFTVVPEPASLAGAGLAVILLSRRTRRR
jgi:hypothetical protein